MTAVWTRVRTEARAHIRGMVALALIVGLAGGAALTAFAGARRTDTAVDRFMAYSRSPEANVGAPPGPDQEAVLDKILALPQVSDGVVGAYMLMVPLDASGRPMRKGDLGTQAIVKGGYENAGRPIFLAGRLPRPDRADEAVINASGAKATGLHVGSRLRLQGFSPDQADELLRGSDLPPTGPIASVHIVGVARFPFELSTAPTAPGVIYAGSNFLFTPPAFFRAYGDKVALAGGVGGAVRLKRGAADLPAFEAAAHDISADAFVDASSDDKIAATKAKHATGLEALALLLFGILTALVAVAIVAQALSRQAFLDAVEYPALGAMGMTRGQLVLGATIRAAAVGVGGAVIALALALLLSPRMPIGIARQAEVQRGYSFDVLVLLGGAALIVVFCAGAAALAAWRTAHAVRLAPGPVALGTAEDTSRVAERVARSGLSPSAVVGVRMALEPGRGVTAVPVRTTLVSAAVAVALLAGTVTFAASLHRLATTPVLQGWNWDVAVGNPHSDDISATAIPALRGNPHVASFTGVAGPAGALINGHQVSVMGMDTVKGEVLPPFLDGRAPDSPDEIALAAKDLRRLHVKVGQQVSVATPDGGQPRRMRVVGRMVLTPTIVNDQIRIGDGAFVTMDKFKTLAGSGADSEGQAENVFIMRLERGVHRAAALQRLQGDFPGTVLTALRPTDVENLRRVRALPSVLAVLFAAIAMLTVGHMLVSSVRRRRHDVAILRTMGFVRRQVASAVAWQANTVIAVGLVFGLPAGIAAGRWMWGVVAGQLGVRDQPVVPVLAIAVIALGSIVLATALALAPALVAARTRPADILRTE